MAISNPETAQLPSDYPSHPGRIFYAVNLRPKDALSTRHPYGIGCRYSDDGGQTWSNPEELYLSDPWDTDMNKGCWEPFILPLPDGTIHLYFSDETPYYREGNKYQNISLLESSDGGDSWTREPRIVCYTPSFRDGMPVAMIYKDNIYLSIETNNVGVRLHPQILYTPLSNPCPKREMKNNVFHTMRGVSQPIEADIQKESVMWNSLTPLGGDDILACCMYNGKVTLVRGTIFLPTGAL